MTALHISKSILVTHKECLDGTTSAILFLAAGGKKENIYFSSPSRKDVDEVIESAVNKVTEKYSNLCSIIIVDLSVSKEMAKKINDSNIDILLLDHHITASYLTKYPWCEINKNNSCCGSKMFFDKINRLIGLMDKKTYKSIAQYKDLVEVTDDIDRCNNDHKGAENIKIFHQALRQENFIQRFIKNPALEFSVPEQYLIKIYCSHRQDFLKKIKNKVSVLVKTIDGNDIRFGFVVSDKYQSDIGEALYSDLDLDLDVVVIIGSENISFRSSKDCLLDLSVLASLNQGGGHKCASGCKVSSVLGENIVELIKHKLKYM